MILTMINTPLHQHMRKNPETARQITLIQTLRRHKGLLMIIAFLDK